MEYGFTHVTSSPRYPQANGEAERAVDTVKGLWKGGGYKVKALLTYHATPLESGYSPAQLLMGRQIHSDIPQLPAALRPRWPNIKGFRKSGEGEPTMPLQPTSQSSLPAATAARSKCMAAEREETRGCRSEGGNTQVLHHSH